MHASATVHVTLLFDVLTKVIPSRATSIRLLESGFSDPSPLGLTAGLLPV